MVVRLIDLINATNNPTIDNIVSFGKYINDVPSGFVLFDGYSGRITPAFPSGEPFPIDDGTPMEVWYSHIPNAPFYEAGAHIGFRNLIGNPEVDVTLQADSIYIHPSTSPRTGAGVRIQIPTDYYVSVVGDFTRGDICGENSGFTIYHGSIPIVPRVIVNGGDIIAINIPATLISANETVDFIVDIGNDGTLSCDDSAIRMTLTVIPVKIAKPSLQANLICSSITATLLVPFQDSGVVELYKVGSATPIATAPIQQIPETYNGTCTFNSINLEAGGDYYFIAKNGGQQDSDKLEFTIEPCLNGCSGAVSEVCGIVTYTDCNGKKITESLKIGQYRCIESTQPHIGLKITGDCIPPDPCPEREPLSLCEITAHDPCLKTISGTAKKSDGTTNVQDGSTIQIYEYDKSDPDFMPHGTQVPIAQAVVMNGTWTAYCDCFQTNKIYVAYCTEYVKAGTTI